MKVQKRGELLNSFGDLSWNRIDCSNFLETGSFVIGQCFYYQFLLEIKTYLEILINSCSQLYGSIIVKLNLINILNWIEYDLYSKYSFRAKHSHQNSTLNYLIIHEMSTLLIMYIGLQIRRSIMTNLYNSCWLEKLNDKLFTFNYTHAIYTPNIYFRFVFQGYR